MKKRRQKERGQKVMQSRPRAQMGRRMDRSIGKIILAEKLNLDGEGEYLGMQEKTTGEVLEFVS